MLSAIGANVQYLAEVESCQDDGHVIILLQPMAEQIARGMMPKYKIATSIHALVNFYLNLDL